MGDISKIEWTQRTWNPWRGCTMVSQGCENCYMFREQKRYGLDPSVVTRTKTWKDPLKWQRKGEANGAIDLVFTCSWSDWFHKDADPWRDEAWEIIKACPNLIFQILTKRATWIDKKLPRDWGSGYPNVWLGVSVETMKFVYRVDYLRDIPAIVRFISYEPALGPLIGIDLRNINWLIAGEESGLGARPAITSWFTDVRDACAASGVKFFMKQRCLNGRKIPFDEWPSALKIREFPAYGSRRTEPLRRRLVRRAQLENR